MKTYRVQVRCTDYYQVDVEIDERETDVCTAARQQTRKEFGDCDEIEVLEWSCIKGE